MDLFGQKIEVSVHLKAMRLGGKKPVYKSAFSVYDIFHFVSYPGMAPADTLSLLCV